MFRDLSLLYFYEVAHAGSIRQAAEHLHISSSAISRMIAKAEHQFQAELFERRAGGMRLTPAGKILADSLSGVFAQLKDATTRINEFKGLRRGDISLWCIEGAVFDAVPNLITSFNRKYPDIRFDVRIGGPDEIIAALLADTADLGITFGMRRQTGIDVLTTFEHQLFAIAAPSHPLARRRQVSLRELATYPIAMGDPSLSIRHMFDRALRARRIKASMLVTTNSVALSLGLVREGAFVTISGRLAAGREISAGYLKAIPIREGDSLKGRLTICKHAGRRLGAAATELLKYAEQALQKI